MRKLGFFLFSTKLAGVENHITNLINSWPNKNDQIFLIINDNFNNFSNIQNNIKRPIFFCKYKDQLNYKNHNQKNFFQKLIVRLKFIFFLFLKKEIFFKKILENKFDNILLVNGGYPGSFYHLLMAKSWKRFAGKKICMAIHNYPKKNNFLSFLFDIFIDLAYTNLLGGIITVSKSCQMELKKKYFIKKLKIKTIHNGIQYINNINVKKKDKILNILMIAIYEDRKGFSFILDCMKELKSRKLSFKLFFFGDYSSKDILEIKNLIYSRSLEKYVDIKTYQNNKLKIFSNKDLLVLPSKYEAFGLALIEAMMFKVPVIASNIGGPKEIIEDTQTGFLVNFGNIKQMCDKIELLNTNKKLYNYIVNKAYKRYHKFFNSKLMSNKYFNLLK